MTSDPLEVTPIPACDPAADAELADFLEACPASFAQQTPGWRDVITRIDRDEPLFLGARRRGALVGVLPGYRFEGPLGAILTSVPQSGPLGGVACHPDADPEPVYAALLGAYAELAASRGCAFATVITNPLWPDRDLYARHFEPDYVLENTCQVLDLERAFDSEGRLLCASASLRRNLRKAESGQLYVDEDQSAANVDEWYGIHAARHAEIGARPLPRGLFTSGLECMVPRDKARFFFVRRADSDELVAGGFYVYHGTVIDALMPSVSSEHARLGAGFLLAMHSIRWARDRGLRYYNWQASPPDSGVYRFKRQWGSRDVDYCYVTRVTGDPEPFLRSRVEEVRAGYPWHYVLPFDRIGARGPSRPEPSSRRSAWRAAESAGR